jgi:hypothetical protein
VKLLKKLNFVRGVLMKLQKIKVEYPKGYSAYDEDCCGSHAHEELTITSKHASAVVKIVETNSGIGGELVIYVGENEDNLQKLTSVYVDDDGIFRR